MPPPPHYRSPMRPAEYFGIGGLPINEYFKPEKETWRNRAYSPIARESAFDEEAQTRKLQQQSDQWGAEDMAREYIAQAPGKTTDELIDSLSPEILMAPQGQSIRQLVDIRADQDYRRAISNQSLGPSLAMKLADNPTYQKQFMADVAGGMEATEAYNKARQGIANEEDMAKLAESGIADADMATFQKEDGSFDRVAIARHLASTKARGKTAISPADLITIQSKLSSMSPGEAAALQVAMENQGYDVGGLLLPGEKRLKDLTPDQLLRYRTAAELWSPEVRKEVSDGLYQAGFNAEPLFGIKRPQPAAPGQPATPAPEAPPPEAVPSIPPTLEELEQAESKLQAKSAEDQQIDAAWAESKAALVKKLKEKYTDEQIKVIARAIAAGRMVAQDPSVIGEGQITEAPYDSIVLNKIGLAPLVTAFSEPLNRRWGSQKVNYQELIRAWANDVAKKEAESPITKESGPVRGPGGSVITVE